MPKKKRLTAAERRILLEKNKKILKRILKYKKYIIGLDIGTNTTGFYSDLTDGLALSGYNDPNRYSRIFLINQALLDILKSDRFQLNKNRIIAIIEDYSLSLRSSTIMQIAELTGIIKINLLTFNIPYVKVAPQTLKKFVLGPSRSSQQGNKITKRHQQKQFILLETLDRWGKKFNDDNTCDAFCLKMFLQELKDYLVNEEKITKWKKDMFDKFIIDRGIPEMPLDILPSNEDIYP